MISSSSASGRSSGLNIKRLAAMLAIPVAACSDAGGPMLHGTRYALTHVNDLPVPAQVNVIYTGSGSIADYVIGGAIHFRTADSALLTLHTRTSGYDPFNALQTFEEVCSSMPVAYRMTSDRVYLDHDFVAPPSQGGFAVHLHDTLPV